MIDLVEIETRRITESKKSSYKSKAKNKRKKRVVKEWINIILEKEK